MFRKRPSKIVTVEVEVDDQINVGDIVLVGYNTGNSYYMAVVTGINEDEEMVTVKDITQIEDNIQPMRCITKATLEECADELRSLYGFYS